MKSPDTQCFYDALIVPCAGFRQLAGGQFVPSDLRDRDDFGILGGGMRIAAAITLVQEGQSNTVIFSGGVSQKNVKKFGHNVPPEADIYAEAFQRRFRGKPEIIKEARSTNSFQNIINSLNLAKEIGLQTIAIVTNDYHTRRLKEQYKRLVSPDIKRGVHVIFLSAERELEMAKSLSKVQKRYYRGSHTQLRYHNEKQGVRNLRNGTYDTREQVGSPLPTVSLLPA